MKLLPAVFLAAALVQEPFTPPKLDHGEAPALPPPTVVAGGQVLIEALIDEARPLTPSGTGDSGLPA